MTVWRTVASAASFFFGITGLPWWFCLLPAMALTREVRRRISHDGADRLPPRHGSLSMAVTAAVAVTAGLLWSLLV